MRQTNQKFKSNITVINIMIKNTASLTSNVLWKKSSVTEKILIDAIKVSLRELGGCVNLSLSDNLSQRYLYGRF